MAKYLFKRSLQGVLVLIGLSFLIFILSRVIPGDPARLALGARASEEAVETLREELNLDKPIITQYALWFKDFIRGDMGISLYTKRAVTEDIKEFLPVTIELMLVSGVLAVVFAIVFGLLAARYRNTFIDGLIRVMAYLAIAIPSFVWTALFLLFFGFTCRIIPVLGRLSPGVVPPPYITGMYIFDGIFTGNFAAAGNAFAHLILPATALAIAPIFQEARILRSSMIDNASKEYVLMATSYGIRDSKIMRKHLFRTSFAPVLNVMGMDFASLLGNAFLAEIIFALPGISSYSVYVMISKDLNAISAVILVIGLVYLVVNIIVDVITAMVDPRIRLGGVSR